MLRTAKDEDFSKDSPVKPQSGEIYYFNTQFHRMITTKIGVVTAFHGAVPVAKHLEQRKML